MEEIRKNSYHFFKILVLCILIGGCTTYKYLYSKPSENQSIQFHSNGILVYERENFDIFLHPKNNLITCSGVKLPILPLTFGKQFKEEFNHSQKYFDIEVVLHSQIQGYFFDPKKVQLFLKNGEMLYPEKYLVRSGPAHMPLQKGPHNLLYSNPSDPYWKNENVHYDSRDYALIFEDALWGAGFILRFSTATPRPGEDFTLQINGITYLDNDVNIPKIIFDGSSVSNWTFYY